MDPSVVWRVWCSLAFQRFSVLVRVAMFLDAVQIRSRPAIEGRTERED